MVAVNLPVSDADSPPRVLFVTGTNYCGSTLTSFVLDGHEQILSIGEMGPSARFETAEFPCSCGVPVVRCEFFRTVSTELEARGVRFDPGAMDLRLTYSENRLLNRLARASLPDPIANMRDAVRDRLPPIRSKVRRIADRTRAFVDAALHVAGKVVFLDATKTPERIPMLDSVFDLKVVHLIRDPRGFSSSLMRRTGCSPETAAWQWAHVQRRVERALGHLDPHRSCVVHYEELVEEPGTGFAALAEFIGVRPFDALERRPQGAQHIIGNPMRLDGDRDIQRDDSWRGHLTPHDLEVIATRSGPVARGYGYDI